ncbi:MAG: ABC transporter ATP-binding protein [Spirochaetaceae bacterium]|nr:MAG: ABC transporter ATP-binding protein [Spirochaetaceae bacterium]
MNTSTADSPGLPPVVTVSSVHKRYRLGERVVDALRGVSLTIPAGTICAIVGPSGSGKSTLLNVIGLLDTPDSGTIRLEERDVASLNPTEAARVRRTRLGFIFQDFNLIPVLSAFENVELPLRVGQSAKAGRREWVMSLLDAVGLADHWSHRPGQLSGGQQQRVAIARALVNRPGIVLADEPTANLDSATGHSILELMHRFNRELGTTFVFSTHDPAVEEMARSVVRLHDGVVAA